MPMVSDRAEIHVGQIVLCLFGFFLHQALPRSPDRTQLSDPNKMILSSAPRFHQLTNVVFPYLSVID